MQTGGFSEGGLASELLRHSADLLVEVGLDGRLLFVSEASSAILGRRPDSLIGLSFMEVVVPEDRARTLSAFRKILETGAEPTLKLGILRVDGLPVRLELVIRTFRDESTGRMRICASGRDISQRHAQEVTERTRNDHYRAIVESGSHPALVTDTNGGILFANRRFYSLFGRIDRLEHAAWRMTPSTRMAAQAAWNLSREGDGYGSVDFEFEGEDGRPRWLSAVWQAFHGPEDEERRVSMVIEDITRRRSTEEAFRTLAHGPVWSDQESARRLITLFARSLELDRLVFGLLDPADSDLLQVVAGWQDGDLLESETLELAGLPDADVARGETCIHPAALHQLMPDVERRLGEAFEAYAGLPLRLEGGEVTGLIAGYSRRPIHDPPLLRSLLRVFGAHAAAGLHRHAADARIRESRNRFEALARHPQDLLTEIDAQGNITYVSAAARPMLGYEEEDLLGRNVLELVHPDDHPKSAGSMAELLEGASRSTHMTRARHADGGFRWLESRMSRFLAADGSARILSLSRDVTRQRRDTLGRGLLYSVVQQGSDLVLACETDTMLLYANAVATRLLGSPEHGPIEGKTLLELLTPESALKVREQILPRLEQIRSWSGELDLIRPNQTENLPTEATIFLFSDPETSTRPLLAVTLRDITERRAAEAALRETESRLGQAQKMEAVGRLAGGIAHDFNNLLTAIIGYSDLVLDELGPEHGARRDAEEILSAAERAGGLTRQLLAFSRRQILQPEQIDLNAVVADIDRLMRRLIGEDIQIVTLLDGELARILADPSQIEQVILNLVVNARDAMPLGGRLEIETRNLTLEGPLRTDSGLLEAGRYVELRVSDTGVGMDDATRVRIFEPFFTTKSPDRGTGLGLATVYGIVSQSGGQVQAESRLGDGSTFRIYLPQSQERSMADARSSQPSSVGGHETILLVEDSEVVRTLIERTLSAAGYEVLGADSATGALRHCSRHEGPISL
ncbi:MAG: PAS domain S-box protein, partial [bacterium]